MQVSKSPDIFQEQINELVVSLEFAGAHLASMLLITKGKNLGQVLIRMSEVGLKITASKSLFCKTEI